MKVSKFHSPPVPSSGLLPHRREEDILNPLPWALPPLSRAVLSPLSVGTLGARGSAELLSGWPLLLWTEPQVADPTVGVLFGRGTRKTDTGSLG